MPEGREGISSPQEADEPVEHDTESDVQDSERESDTELETRKESARETVERVFKEAAENPGDGDEGEKEAAAETDEGLTPKADKRADRREWDPDLQPPGRYSAEEKEDFNKLPKGQKRLINKMVKEHEATFTQTQQQYAVREREFNDIENVIRPFQAEWAKGGYSRSQAIAELVGCHEKLRNPDENVREDEIVWLVENCKVRPERLMAKLGFKDGPAANSPIIDISSHPVVKKLEQELYALRAETAPVTSSYRHGAAQQERQMIDSVTAEMSAVKHETDRSGRYRYPDLHDDSFLDRVKPIVSGLIGTVPNISYGDALKRAYIAAGGRVVGNSAQPQTVFPAPNQSNSQNRALSAAGSLRGRSAPSIGVSDEATPPPEALKNPRASVEWAFRNAGRGR